MTEKRCWDAAKHRSQELPITLIFAGYFLKSEAPLFAGIIILGHIGADRLLGFGLKYPTTFKDTHLQRV